MQFLFRFLGSVLFVMVRVFFFLKTYPSENIRYIDIVTGAFSISVIYSLLIWTIRKGKWWLLLSLITGLYFWLELGTTDPEFREYFIIPNLIRLKHFIQMIAFVCIITIADNAFKNSRKPAIILILFALIAFGYGYSLFKSGNLVGSNDAFTTSGYSNNESSYLASNHELVFPQLSY